MPIVLAKCTECGGTIKVDSDKKLAVCENCSQPFVVEEAINNFTNYYETNYITNNTTHNYSDGTVVNVYEDKNKDFVIEAGVLKEYHGEDSDIIIPDNVCEIGNCAFDNMGIKSITIPRSVIKIGAFAFNRCKKLIRVDYSGTFEEWNEIEFNTVYNATANPNYYAQNLYINGKRIEGSLYIPNNISKISNLSLCGCKDLKQVFIPDSVTEIGLYAFYGCVNLAKIDLPKNLISIDAYAFYDCGMTNISVPKSVKYIGEDAFSSKSLEKIELFCTEICTFENAFEHCSNLNKVMINETVDLKSLIRVPITGTNVIFKNKDMQISYWKKTGKCKYCGGEFKDTLLFERCKICGKIKDY